ncbi:DUF1289 domain-containing protein [Aestuariirhabdus sp. Z084]|uniref:DUF1289 domain-containing protein n=1 Tax=Aestuariirhabdus haliotis TaxID=2918751 RepID=UPI00201B42AC|nr:DUF1289 domain-containing protein [Aestuariirhabdus haliotis]MCL6416792.1 DUF1289 domain-containing protein [Aestuariirhabdus haliotis]MCL6420792.1 DUF1289 domain-containing protein [Aestuariirhabdus haliotis]
MTTGNNKPSTANDNKEQFELFDIDSPCRSICTTNNRGFCVGCLRSRDERFNWNQMTQTQRAEVMALCKRRRARIKQRMADREEVQLDLLLDSNHAPLMDDLFDPLLPGSD